MLCKALILRLRLQDLSALRVDSPNALATVAALLVSVIVPVVVSKRSSTTTLFLLNGLLCLLSGAVTFYAAVSPDLRFTWQTGDAAFDELLGWWHRLLSKAVLVI